MSKWSHWPMSASSSGGALRLPLESLSWSSLPLSWRPGWYWLYSLTSSASSFTPGSSSGAVAPHSLRTSRRPSVEWALPSCCASSPYFMLVSTCSAGQLCSWKSTALTSSASPRTGTGYWCTTCWDSLRTPSSSLCGIFTRLTSICMCVHLC